MPGGRPKKTVAGTLKDGWQGEILALMEQGASKVEVMGMLGINQELFYRWMEDEKEFSDTVKRGLNLSKVWWEAKGRTSLNDKTFSPTLWYMNMKNRFGWADKQEIHHKSDHVVKFEFVSPQQLEGKGQNEFIEAEIVESEVEGNLAKIS